MKILLALLLVACGGRQWGDPQTDADCKADFCPNAERAQHGNQNGYPYCTCICSETDSEAMFFIRLPWPESVRPQAAQQWQAFCPTH